MSPTTRLPNFDKSNVAEAAAFPFGNKSVRSAQCLQGMRGWAAPAAFIER
jgi:hypothetical protein